MYVQNYIVTSIMTGVGPFNVDFDKICRICLKESALNHSICLQYNESIKFSEMLEDLIGDTIVISENGQVIPSICNECSAQLTMAYEFKLQCLKNHQYIKWWLDNQISATPDSDEDVTDQTYLEVAIDHKWHKSVDKWDCDSQIVKLDDVSSIPKAGENVNTEEISKLDVSSIPMNTGQISKDNVMTGKILLQSNSKKFSNKSGRRHCLKCNIEFSDLKSYNTHHRQLHTPQMLCPLCGKLVRKHALEKHLASSAHNNNNKKHKCTECGKSYTLADNLIKHKRIHTGDKRYTCEYCNMKFIHWNSKRSHIRTFHTGEKKYECNICGNKFAQSSNFYRHLRAHTGELPHECTFCDKKFITSSELKNHLVVHTKERNHKCNVCQKAFGTKKSLRTHTKIHTGERNYVCTECGRAFTQAHVLRGHLKTHPNCPIPPAGTVLSQKALNKLPIVFKIENTLN